VAAAVTHLHAGLEVPENTGTFAGDFAAVAAQAVASGDRTNAAVFMPLLLAEAAGNPDLHAIFTANLVTPRRRVVRVIVERAQARGEIREDVDPEVAIDLLVGPSIYRLLLGGAALGALREHSAAVVAAAMAGLSPR